MTDENQNHDEPVIRDKRRIDPETGQVRNPEASEAAAGESADSGEGKRVVFDMSDQRVWLVREDRSVERSYLVSGSLYDNLDPGSYEVYSRSARATGIDESGTMRFMVRFAHGERAAIGFHDIPVDDGRLVQTRGQLGTPQSHGCIRQWRPDAAPCGGSRRSGRRSWSRPEASYAGAHSGWGVAFSPDRDRLRVRLRAGRFSPSSVEPPSACLSPSTG